MTVRHFSIRTNTIDLLQDLDIDVSIDTSCATTRKAIVDGVWVYDSKLAEGPDFEAILKRYCQLIGERLLVLCLNHGDSLYNVKKSLDKEEGFFEIFSKENVKIEFVRTQPPIIEMPDVIVSEVTT